MLRAIAQTAVSEAGRHGEYRAAFRGFRIYAVRWAAQFGHYVAIEVAYGSARCARGVLIAFVRAEDHDALLTEECYEGFDARTVESIALSRVI